ncbi:Rieske Fe-S protein [Desulfuromusa kysingii]|uniref:Rieske Fe-S protein n=1 Tax=Desulfuromusa kysingii TaxID=37625 RepID=A0A1H4CQP2_9BACT|nr:ubiquinol-cytochrome c reductase iron-sulfur subunit [Desulfuromusa kysingii]SEA62608.1 Rieske Fe-S protein [Desulfuromusa kysingii]
MEKTAWPRRKFLKGIALIGVFGGLAWRFLVPSKKARKKVLFEVDKNDIPLRGALVYKRSRVVIIRSETDIYALSLVCTHLGCTVNVTAENILCPCHGSVFDREGNVLKGPSDRPLERLEVEERGEKLVVLV